MELMSTNFHIIVLVTTFIVYIYFKLSKDANEHNKKSNLIFILLTPVILYTANYFYNKQKLEKINNDISDISNISDVSSDLLSIPYPQSTNDS